ncbi:MAG TPA: tetratricopeptide repeat protein [Gaiellaceae bacterium]
MSRTTRISPPRAGVSAGLRLGERVRQLRVAAGLTQSELAGDRCSKEYVSQIERGKTRPPRETIEWIAARLGVDGEFLANGVTADQRGRVEAALARGEALTEANREAEALAEFDEVRSAVLATGLPELEVRALNGEAFARHRLGQVREALELLNRSRLLVEGPGFSDVERADVLFRMGVGRYRLSSIQTALALLNEALALAEGSGFPCDQLRASILNWRSRCYRRQRDLEAAREDVERALELAEGLKDSRTMADLSFQASIVADREGHWVLARTYAERAKAYYEELADRTNVGRLLNNLGGLNFLLGHPEQAIEFLKDAFRVALEVSNDAEAAQAVGSLAQVHLRTGDPVLAEEQARHALRLLAGREDYLDEIGMSQLVLGRALMEQDRLDDADAAFEEADSTFERFESISHRAACWVAKGDLAARRGEDHAAALLYRRAAEALQDVRF